MLASAAAQHLTLASHLVSSTHQRPFEDGWHRVKSTAWMVSLRLPCPHIPTSPLWSVCSAGDGGNDVSMIQESDCGVGVEGKVSVCTQFFPSVGVSSSVSFPFFASPPHPPLPAPLPPSLSLALSTFPRLVWKLIHS